MEGKRLLRNLTQLQEVESLATDVRNYVYPLLSSDEDVSKYSLFALKAMKICLEKLSCGEHCTVLLEVAMICAKAVKKREREASFNAEKLLVNLVSHCVRMEEVENSMYCSGLVVDRLAHVNEEDEKLCSQASMMLKVVADLTWRLAMVVEQKQSSSVVEKVFEIRHQSLLTLLAAKTDLCLLASRAIKADTLFQKAQHGKQQTHTSVVTFHDTLLTHKLIQKHFSPLYLLSSCDVTTNIHLWLLQAAKTKSCRLAEACSLLEHHLKHCSHSEHNSELFLQELAWLSFHRTSMSSPTREWIAKLDQCSSLLSSCVCKGGNQGYTPHVVESLDDFITMVRSARKEWREKGLGVFLHRDLFWPLKKLLTSYVKLLERLKLATLSRGGTREQEGGVQCRIVSRQLVALSLACDALLDTLLVHKDKEDAELSQGSPVPFAQSHSKELLASECYLLVKQAHDMLLAAPPTLPTTERLWVGTDAYNIGVVLQQHEMNSQAVLVLQCACEDLALWCSTNGERSYCKIKLVRKYCLLSNCYLSLDQYDDAFATIKHVLTSIPTSHVAEDYNVSLLVSQFVKTKIRISTRNSNHELMNRTIIDLFGKEIDSNDKILFLEEELQQYKLNSRHVFSDVRLAVASVLHSLYLSCSSQSDAARILLELAAVSHEDIAVPIQYVEEAIELLKECRSDDVISECVRLDLTGAAHFWKAVFLHKTRMRNCHGMDGGLSKDEGDLPERLKVAMICDDVESCLEIAVTSWEKCVQKLKDRRLEPKNVVSSLLSSCQLLQLAMTLSFSLQVSDLSFRIYHCLKYLSSSSPDLADVYLWTVSRHAWLSEQVSDDVYSILAIETKKEGQGKVMATCCQLALAHTMLLCKEVTQCCQLLVDVLSDPLVSQSSQSSYFITAQAAMIASRYLRCLGAIPLPWDVYLKELHASSSSAISVDRTIFKMTELEFSLEALKLLRSLAFTKGIITATGKSQQNEEELRVEEDCIDKGSEYDDCRDSNSGVHIVVSLLAWEVMEGLLRCLLDVGTILIRQGAVSDSVHYFKEGLALSQRMCLKYRCVEFLLLIVDAKRLSGDMVAARTLLLQASELLGLSSYVCSLLPSLSSDASDEEDLVQKISQLSLSSPPINHSSTPKHILLSATLLHSCAQQLLNYAPLTASSVLSQAATLLQPPCSPSLNASFPLSLQSLFIQNAQLRAEVLLAQSQPSEAIAACNEVTNSNSLSYFDPDHRVRYAELYLTMGKAAILSIELCYGTVYFEGIGGRGINENIDCCILSSKDMDLKVGSAKKRRAGQKRRKAKQTSKSVFRSQKESALSSTSFPVVLHPALCNLFTSYQLCHPSRHFFLLREAAQLLALCLASWDQLTASHLVLLSSQVTLTHKTILNLGHKIIQSLTQSLASLLLSSLTNGINVDSSKISHFVQARATLYLPSTHSPTLTHTEQFIDTLQSQWTFCQLTIVRSVPSSTQYMIMLRVRYKRDPVIIRIPLLSAAKTSSSIASVLFTPNLIDQFGAIMSASCDTMSLTNKKEWWKLRAKLDNELKELLDTVQQVYFGPWRLLLQGAVDMNCEDLAAIFKRHRCTPVSDVWLEILMSSSVEFSHEEVAVVLGAVCAKEVPDSLIEEVMEFLQLHQSTLSTTSQGPLLLCLCPQLQALPLESQQCLIEQPASRVPSLSFLSCLVILCSSSHSNISSSVSIDTHRTFYLVNPKGDLVKTEKAFRRWFVEEEGWKGVTSREPTSDEIESALQDHHMFIYWGHGSGREFISSNHLQKVTCSAAVVQMGCSSGKLSVRGLLDPTGNALNYLVSGCPCIIGNLWDVTDQDIDRYCTKLLKTWLHEHPPGTQLQSSASLSRTSCKMPYLIGASPVVYGLPLTRQHN